jgi:transcriptional regulator with XRE-family HTH domain
MTGQQHSDHNAPMTARESLAERLRMLRAERGISLAQLARATGISSSFLSLIEVGQSDLTVSRLVRLANFYEVDPADLLAPTPRPPGEHVLILRPAEDHALHSDAEGVDMFDLAAGADRAFSPMLFVFNPGGALEIEDDPAREVMIFVLQGTFSAVFDHDDAVTLRRGEGVLFRDVATLRVTNTGRASGRLLGLGVSLHRSRPAH